MWPNSGTRPASVAQVAHIQACISRPSRMSIKSPTATPPRAAHSPTPDSNTPNQAIDEIRSLDQNDYAIAGRGDHVRGNHDVCRTLCNWRGRPVSGAG